MRIFRRITFCFICAIFVLLGVGVLAAPEKQGGRFLFLVEKSAAMDANKVALRNTLRTIIESGLDGQMQYGDTIGLWTYNDALNAGFPMVYWRREHIADITNAVDFWMSKQKFVHRTDFSKVMPMLQNVIKPSQKLTIIWISTGNDKIAGTPFDSAIDELHMEFRDDFRKQHIPFVTLLAVRKGAITDFTVNPGDAKIRLPAVMEKEAAEAKVATTNLPVAKAVVSTAPKKEPLIIKVGPSPELIEQKKAAEAARVETNTPPVATAPPINISTVAAASQAVASTNIAAVAPNKLAATVPTTNTAVSVQSNVVPSSPPTAVIAKPAVAATNAQTAALTTNVTTVSNDPAQTTAVIKPHPVQEPAPTPAIAVTAQLSSMAIAIGAGALLLIGAIILLVVKQAGAPKGPSFISQSMTRERLNSDASKQSSDNPADHE
jgi:hypothetical protein